MDKIVFVDIKPSKNKLKKFTAIFYDKNNKKIKTTNFGQKGFSDYTIHKNEARKKAYLDRHRKNENWNDYTSAGSLSRFLLWNKTTFLSSLSDYLNRFNLKLYKKR